MNLFKFPSIPSPSRIMPLAVLLFLCFILTTGNLRAQAPDDHGNTLADATPITLGTTVTGVIDPGGDLDVFRFEITGASTDVWIYTRGGISDTAGGLYDGFGRPIASSDDSALSENPTHFHIGANLGPGTYYIAVAGYDATITGPYSLHTRTAADQGGTVDAAADLTLGEPVDGVIGTAWEEDVYRIDLSTATGPTDVILYTTGDVDTTGELVDENLREVEYGDDSILSEQRSNFFLGSVLEPGVYYIFVSGYSTSTGPYRLHSWTGTDPAGARATSADLGLESEQLGIIGSPTDEDYFRITVSEATDLQVYTEGSADTVGELLDGGGNRLAYNDDSDFSLGTGSFFLAKSLSPGTYYVAVSSLDGDTGPYRLFAMPTVDQSDEADTAEAFEPGTPVMGLIDPGTDADLFMLEMTDAAEVFIYTTGDVDTIGTLVDSDGATIGTDDDNGAQLNFFIRQTLGPGTYYIRVEGYLSETGPYALFAEPAPPYSLAPGTRVVEAIAEGYDEDYYKIEIADTTDAWIFALGSLDTVGTLYDNNFNEIAFNDDSHIPGQFRAFHFREILGAGTYYLKVGSFNAGTGRYAVYVLPVTEPGNDTASAAPLPIGLATPGTVASGGQDDYLRVDFAESTHVYIIGVGADGGPVEAEVLDGNGNPIDINERAPYFEYDFFIWDTFGPGTYYVKVSAGYRSPAPYTVIVLDDPRYTAFVAGCTAETAGLTGPPVGDDLYACQWHLKNRQENGKDINVEPVWEEGITGEGVNVVVVDDGIDQYHEDLAPNIDASLNHDYTDLGDIYHPKEHHGTAVAGVIAARDNEVGVRGVAPRATIYGYNFLVGQYILGQSDFVLANSMTRNRIVTAVSNNSWGPGVDHGWGAVPTYWELAVEQGVREGYDGKGTFYAFAAGNSALDGADVNLNELANFYAVTGVCAVNDRDRRSDYSDWGAPLWVCAPSNDARGSYRGIVTTENSDRYHRYTFGGTSAASPIVAGVAALMRDTNPDLTWRDLKLILAASARKNDPGSPGWEDGALQYGSTTERYHFNHEYGFGMVDAKAAVDLAKGWTIVPPLETVETTSGDLSAGIPDLPSSGASTTMTHTVNVNTGIEFVEFVEVRASFAHPSLRDLEIELVSPSGKTSKLLRYYDSDDLIPLNSEVRLGASKHLGENPNGLWMLRVADKIGNDLSGILESWTIKVYGHRLTPAAPTVDLVTPSGNTITIAWSAPAVNRGTGVTSYDLRYIPTAADKTDGSSWTVVENVWTANPGGNLQHVITGLVGSTQYDVQVRAVNSAGAGAWSETAAGATTTPEAGCATGGALAALSAGPELTADCEALLALRGALVGSAPLNWSAGLAFDQWDGVTAAFPVGGEQRRVTKLELGGKFLTGRIPSSLGSLTGLENLDLSNNSLTGAIPAELGNLTRLTRLRLNNNDLKGRIPTELGSLANLRVLDLSENRLNGAIPAEPGTLTSLTELRLDRNRLEGNIPAELNSFTNLKVLRLDDNRLSGNIPAELTTLTRLQVMDLSQNGLTGDIPSELDNLRGLRQLDLADNDLSGAIPSALGTRLTKLERLDLSNNGLTGEISDRLTYITGLVELDLSGNRLSGSIPAAIHFLSNLEKLYLNDNQFDGVIPARLGNLNKLEELYLSRNPLTGCIPTELRDTTNNDLSSLGLPYCDVLLSSLTVSGATLMPGFDPAITEYTAVAGPMRVTVTPTGGAGVTFKLLDRYDFEFVDADDMLDGHQVDLDYAETIIKVRVISADGTAAHTYTILVSRAGIPDAPAISSITPGAASLHVAWTAPVNTGGAPVVSYDLRYIETDAATKSDTDWTVAQGASTGALTGVVKGLTADIEHDVQVRAFNGAHSSPWSATATGTPDVGACSTGTAVTAVVTDPDANPGLVSDCEALLAVEDSLQGSETLNWSVDLSMHNWEGVTLGGDPVRVTGLDRSGGELTGPVPSPLGRLTGLEGLDLSGNGLTGEIPSSLEDLGSLEILGLNDNELEGEIPSWLGNLSSLSTVRLDENGLYGEIPSSLGNLTNLVELRLNDNQLYGDIPPELGNLTNLVQLRLDQNHLSGNIPSLADLSGLTELRLQENELTGPVPSWLGSLTMLEEVDLSGNGLTGTIPLSLAALSEQSGQPNLRALHLGGNALTGSVPVWLGNLNTLEKIGLGGNQLTGDIPPELGDLAKLEYLDLSGNELTGTIPGKLAGLGNTSVLATLLLGGNQLTGEIPVELGDLIRLEQLDLSENQLSGEIPPALGDLTALMKLSLNNNGLTGEIPAALRNLTALTVLDIQENRLTGEIPAALGALINLEELRIGSNRLTGEIPPLGSLTKLESLTLYNNQLSGQIPFWIGNLTMLKELNLGYNQLTGPIPPSLGNLANLEVLSLADNPLGGSIPSQLGDLSALKTLDLRYNQLTGEPPVELGNLRNLELLYLGNNELTGPVPAWLRGLTTLRLLHLAQNQFTGGIPGWLSSLTNLEVLFLYQNQFSGCIPHELRGVPINDLDVIDLVHCDVLLSGLSISPGILTPRFDPYQTEYSASADASRITVTPVNEYGAAFLFLDADDAEIPDASETLDGRQIDVPSAGDTVKVEVVSQDQAVSHTYTIVVTLDDLISRYDRDGNGAIDREEAIAAVVDYFAGLITKEEAIEVIVAYFAG